MEADKVYSSQDNGPYFTLPHGEEVKILVPDDTEPSEEGANGSISAKDDNVVSIDAGVSFTAVSPEPIPIPAPVCQRVIFMVSNFDF